MKRLRKSILLLVILTQLAGCVRIAQIHAEIRFTEQKTQAQVMNKIFRLFKRNDYKVSTDTNEYKVNSSGWASTDEYHLITFQIDDPSAQVGIAIRIFDSQKIDCRIVEFGNGRHFTSEGDKWAQQTLSILKKHFGPQSIRIKKRSRVRD